MQSRYLLKTTLHFNEINVISSIYNINILYEYVPTLYLYVIKLYLILSSQPYKNFSISLINFATYMIF